ncbi:hypothetical protein AAF888_10455 [Bacillus thuringiensis]
MKANGLINQNDSLDKKLSNIQMSYLTLRHGKNNCEYRANLMRLKSF